MRENRHLENSWFIEALDTETEKFIKGEISEMNFRPNVLCQGGQRYNLWFCNSNFVSEMRKRRKNFNLEFKVFYKKGKEGEIKEI